MGRHAKTQKLLNLAYEILAEQHPMTVRQCYYQLVSRHAIENNKGAYNGVSKLLVYGRQTGVIPWEWIEDRNRRPRHVSMWADLPDFAETAKHAYRRDVWETQPVYVESWLEKDALSGIFEEVLDVYGVTLNVGRGYDGWSSIKAAADRYAGLTQVVILYYGDFDPSGEDMVRSLKDRLAFFKCYPAITKSALTKRDVEEYQLPPDLTKATDTRAAAFVAKNGDMAVELDALPIDVLRNRLETDVTAVMDMEALRAVKETEARERVSLVESLASIKN